MVTTPSSKRGRGQETARAVQLNSEWPPTQCAPGISQSRRELHPLFLGKRCVWLVNIKLIYNQQGILQVTSNTHWIYSPPISSSRPPCPSETTGHPTQDTGEKGHCPHQQVRVRSRHIGALDGRRAVHRCSGPGGPPSGVEVPARAPQFWSEDPLLFSVLMIKQERWSLVFWGSSH